LDATARAADCEYFVAGATARDLVLVNVHGLRPGRATRDIDFGIAVKNWKQFELLKERLIATRAFTAADAGQRLIYADRTAGLSIPIDLIPFRGIASAEGAITWPPGGDIVMQVAGFEEALESSVLIEIEAGLKVRVASAPGLTLLKLTAWAERGLENNRMPPTFTGCLQPTPMPGTPIVSMTRRQIYWKPWASTWNWPARNCSAVTSPTFAKRNY